MRTNFEAFHCTTLLTFILRNFHKFVYGPTHHITFYFGGGALYNHPVLNVTPSFDATVLKRRASVVPWRSKCKGTAGRTARVGCRPGLTCSFLCLVGEIGWGGGVEWIHLAHNRDRWRAIVSAVMSE
jgi:hypothetical protein